MEKSSIEYCGLNDRFRRNIRTKHWVSLVMNIWEVATILELAHAPGQDFLSKRAGWVEEQLNKMALN